MVRIVIQVIRLSFNLSNKFNKHLTKCIFLIAKFEILKKNPKIIWNILQLILYLS